MDKIKSHLKNLKFFTILFILVLAFILLSYPISRAYINKTTFEKDILDIASKNEENIFTINNITFFSSANANSEVRTNSTLNLDNLYQYTDIAIFLNPVKQDLTYENTLKEVFIDNINFSPVPDEGKPNLYYKNINNFADASIVEENKIDQDLHFNITSEDEADLVSPTLYNNCANPISLSYVNSNIKTNYTLADAFTQLAYDGSLLKKCGVTLSSIDSAVSFNIHITNNLNQHFVCPVYLQIPLEDKHSSSIYDGKLIVKKEVNYKFYRIN